MAQHEHIALLQGPSQQWNAWRNANPDLLPDLREAKLVGIVLHDLDLHSALLQGADVSGARFSAVNLKDANLTGIRAWRIQVVASVFDRAILRQADFYNAVLRETSVKYAQCQEAIFLGAEFEDMQFEGADLSDADM
jgi:uncharacterized protein YjbI with pentapeptide repeats